MDKWTVYKKTDDFRVAAPKSVLDVVEIKSIDAALIADKDADDMLTLLGEYKLMNVAKENKEGPMATEPQVDYSVEEPMCMGDRTKEYLEKMKSEGAKHKGKFINAEVCEEYRKRALKIDDKNGSDVGGRRQLRIELQEEYGLLEIEALNIILGFNVQDYLDKYYMMVHVI